MGVHTPRMAGIAGSSSEGAESIVLSGGYEDDEDHGDVIIYTGQGGNDLATTKQVRDQELTRGNLALVRSCLDGKLVRVIRGARHRSSYSPVVGYRYDGLYRVENFWHERGKSGYLIWRFRLVKADLLPVMPPHPDAVKEERTAYDPLPRRAETIITRVIRSTEIASIVKRLYDYRCQVCRIRLETPGGPYAEAAHIRPLGRPHDGPDVLENILCLCPNHHLLFDTGTFTIEDDLCISGTKEKILTAKGHVIGLEYLRYHREHYGQQLRS